MRKWILRVLPVILMSVLLPTTFATQAHATDAACYVQSIAPKLSTNGRYAIAAGRQTCWGAEMGKNQVRVKLQERVKDRQWPLPDIWETRSTSELVVSYGETWPSWDNINTDRKCLNGKRRLHRSVAIGTFWTLDGQLFGRTIKGPGVWLECDTG